MRRARPTFEQRQKILANIDRAYELDTRKRRLYKRYYRKGFLFIAAWATRLSYAALFIIALVFYDTSKGYRTEHVLDSETRSSSSRNGRSTSLYLTTEFDSYIINITNAHLPAIHSGDTVLIEHNVFGKSTYFSKSEWRFKYGIHSNVVFYFMILFASFISCFFNDGLDPFTNKILWLAFSADLIAMTAFFCF